jgi:PAS domain S-box-containing protein
VIHYGAASATPLVSSMAFSRLRRLPAWAVATAAALAQAVGTIPLALWLDAGPAVVAVVAIAVTALVVLAAMTWVGRRTRHLEHAGAELSAIWTRSPHPMLRVDRSGAVVGANPSAQTLLGDPPDGVDGSPLAEVLDGSNGRSSDTIAAMLSSESETEELTYRRSDGAETLLALSAAPVPDSDAEASGSIVFASDIGSERRALAGERAAEARYRALVEALAVTTYLHPPGERDAPFFVSRQAETMIGYSPDELVGRSGGLQRLVHQDDRERVEAELAAAQREERPFRCEYRVVSRTGRVVDVVDTAMTVRDADGTALCTQGFLTDVSDRRLSDEERDRLRRQRRRAIADSFAGERRLDFVADASAVLADSGAVQASLEQLAERATRSFADWCIVDLVEDGDVSRLACVHAEPQPSGPAPGADVEQEVRDVVRSGRAHIAEARLSVPIASRGHVAGVLTFLRHAPQAPYDSRDRAVADTVARAAGLMIANARLHDEVRRRADAADVLAYVGDGVALVDTNGIIRLWNPAAEVITGLSAEAVLGRAAADAVPGWQALGERVPIASRDEIAHPETVPLDAPRGERWISISGVAFFGGTVYAFRDLTDERRLEELRADFVTTASHELRTPLAAVYGAAQTLRRHDFALDEAGRERFVSMIVEESDRLGRIVNEILLASQLDAGRFELANEPFEPGDLVARVVEAARTHAPPGVTVEESAHDGPTVLADREKIRQVLVNLVENAVKYSPDGGRVDVRAESDSRFVRFWVRDEGLGVPPEEQARIFEKFYRVDPEMARGVGGTGLGLYICKELVERMGGRISLESEHGEGSTFFFEVPCSPPVARVGGSEARVEAS